MKYGIAFLSLGVLYFSACNGDSKQTEEDTNTADTDTDTDTEDTDTEDTDTEDTDSGTEDEVLIQETVGAEGGTLEASNGSETVTIEIPPGALTEDVEIGVQETVMEALGAAEDFADVSGTAWVFTPHGTTFEEDIMVSFSQNGTGDTICMLNDEADTMWKMVSDASFSPNDVSFMTNTFSVYVPVSTCETYCQNTVQTCSAAGLDQTTCLSTCERFNLSNPVDTCEDEVIANYRCFQDGTFTDSDFDCETGAPWPWTCMETQYEAQDCSTGGGCDDLVGTWYTRTYSNGQVTTTENAAGTEVELIVRSTVSIIEHVNLPSSLSQEFSVNDYTTVYKHSYDVTDVYGLDIPDGKYPDVYTAPDANGVYKVVFESDQVHSAQASENICNPEYRKIEAEFQIDGLVSTLFKKYVTAADTDGDGWTVDGGDCNEGDSTIYPQAQDPQGDGIDQDCDGIDG